MRADQDPRPDMIFEALMSHLTWCGFLDRKIMLTPAIVRSMAAAAEIAAAKAERERPPRQIFINGTPDPDAVAKDIVKRLRRGVTGATIRTAYFDGDTEATRSDLLVLLAGDIPGTAQVQELADQRRVKLRYRGHYVIRLDVRDDLESSWYPHGISMSTPWLAGAADSDLLGEDALPIFDLYSAVDIVRAIDQLVDWTGR